MTIGNNLECRYLGWGDFNKFRQMPLKDNEALIYTTLIGNAPVLVRGFMDCIRSQELKERLPERFSENDLAAVIVEMVRILPNSLIEEFNEWSRSAETVSQEATVICAVISW